MALRAMTSNKSSKCTYFTDINESNQFTFFFFSVQQFHHHLSIYALPKRGGQGVAWDFTVICRELEVRNFSIFKVTQIFRKIEYVLQSPC